MNKYVLRTSLFWICILALILGFLRFHATRPTPQPRNPEPVTAGPAPDGMNMPMKAPTAMEPARAPVALSPAGTQAIGVQTGKVVRRQVHDSVRAPATVDIDDRRVSYVELRFRGYVRKVFAAETFQRVAKGDPLFTTYSPELVATQEDYLNALRDAQRVSASSVPNVAADARDLAAATEARLRQWNMSESEIGRLKDTGQVIQDVTVSAPVSGFVTDRNVLPNQFADQGARLYTIADLSRVWIHAQVFQDDVGRLKAGDAAVITVNAYPERRFRGVIESILPQVDMTTRTVRVRISAANSGILLKPGMFVNAELDSNLGRQLVIPDSAVLHSGTHTFVFVTDANGRMQRKEVVLGPRAEDQWVVAKGLEAGQGIVTSANFLIDSESQLQAASGSLPTQDAPPQTSTGTTAAPRIEFTTSPTPPHKGKNSLRVKLTSPDGHALEGADVTVTFFMPAMPAMGMAEMNTTSTLSDKGKGVYEGVGALESGGSWQVTINARKAGQTLATQQSRINAEGGM